MYRIAMLWMYGMYYAPHWSILPMGTPKGTLVLLAWMEMYVAGAFYRAICLNVGLKNDPTTLSYRVGVGKESTHS